MKKAGWSLQKTSCFFMAKGMIEKRRKILRKEPRGVVRSTFFSAEVWYNACCKRDSENRKSGWMPMVYTVYGDVLFLQNVFFDFLLLWGVATFSGCDYRRCRLLAGALLGGIYGAVGILPVGAFLNRLPLVLLFPVLLLWLVFGRMERGKFLRLLLYFYLLSFALSGLAAAGQNLLQELGTIGELLPLFLLPVVLIGCLGKFGIGALRKVLERDRCFQKGSLEFAGSKAPLCIFLDTGNQLRDPVSGLPVMVVEYEQVADLLPLPLRQEYETAVDRREELPVLFRRLYSRYGDAPWFRRLTLLSFRSVGRQQGLLLGFRPDFLQVGQRRAVVVVAFYNGILDGKKRFQAIVSPWAFEETKKIFEKKGDLCEYEQKKKTS